MSLKEKAELVKVVYVTLIYHKNNMNKVHKFISKIIEENFFYQGMYAGPIIKDGKALPSLSRNVFLLDIECYDELIKLCNNNNIQIIE